MGCSQSKIENEEAVARCKERKLYMKECVVARNAFAAAHSAYAMSLKNAGAALSDYAQGEFLYSAAPIIPPSSSSSSAAAATSSSPSSSTPAATLIPETLGPPPPPPSLTEDFSPSPLQRAATMPEIKPRLGGGGIGINGTIMEEEGNVDGEEDDDDDVELENRERLVRKSRSRGGSARGRRSIEEETPPPPPMPQPQQQPRQPQQPQPPPQQQQQQPYFDYFFPNVDHMPGTTLEDTSAPPPPPPLPRQPSSPPRVVEEKDPELVERKSVDERPKRVEHAASEPSMELDKGGAASSSGRVTKKGKGAAGGGGEKRVMIRGTVNLLAVFEEIDDNFLKASESAHEVSKMLEATRLHYHSNFADNRGDLLSSSIFHVCLQHI